MSLDLDVGAARRACGGRGHACRKTANMVSFVVLLQKPRLGRSWISIKDLLS